MHLKLLLGCLIVLVINKSVFGNDHEKGTIQPGNKGNLIDVKIHLFRTF